MSAKFYLSNYSLGEPKFSFHVSSCHVYLTIKESIKIRHAPRVFLLVFNICWNLVGLVDSFHLIALWGNMSTPRPSEDRAIFQIQMKMIFKCVSINVEILSRDPTSTSTFILAANLQVLGVAFMWSRFFRSDSHLLIWSHHKKRHLLVSIISFHFLNLWHSHHNRQVIGLQLCAIKFQISKKRSFFVILIGTWNLKSFMIRIGAAACRSAKKFSFYFFWSNFELFMTGVVGMVVVVMVVVVAIVCGYTTNRTSCSGFGFGELWFPSQQRSALLCSATLIPDSF